jgi:BMFP domain-containing protein YqiC
MDALQTITKVISSVLSDVQNTRDEIDTLNHKIRELEARLRHRSRTALIRRVAG